MTLAEFEREGRSLEISVPWHTETLWLVPDTGHARRLMDKGTSSGRVWTAQELKQFATMADLGGKDFQALAELKLLFGGEFVPDDPEAEGGWLTPEEFFGPAYSSTKNLLRAGQKPPDIPCHGCRRREWWKGKDGHWICRVCHPPAHLSSAERTGTEPAVKLAAQEPGE